MPHYLTSFIIKSVIFGVVFLFFFLIFNYYFFLLNTVLLLRQLWLSVKQLFRSAQKKHIKPSIENDVVFKLHVDCMISEDVLLQHNYFTETRTLSSISPSIKF